MGNTPWWAPGAITWVDKHLKKTDKAFEWGSGGSSMWLKSRVGKLISIEHSPKWHRQVKLNGCDVRLISLSGSAYQEAIRKTGILFDWVLVDGRKRVLCMREGIECLRPGGYLLLDDSQRSRYNPGLELVEGWERWNFTDTRQTSIFQKPEDPVDAA